MIQTLVVRGFSDTDMGKAARTFMSGAGGLPEHIEKVFSDPLPDEIVEISKTFVTLQQIRHEADYHQSPEFSRDAVIGFVLQAEQAFAAWHTLQANPAAKNAIDLFLSSLLLIDRWKK